MYRQLKKVCDDFAEAIQEGGIAECNFATHFVLQI